MYISFLSNTSFYMTAVMTKYRPIMFLVYPK